MFKLDNEFLVSLGLGNLPVEEKNKLLQTVYERLELNVGMRLAEKMTDQQLDEFESFIDRSDEAGALRWLETNFPNYKQVVAEELEKLRAEIQAVAPQIIAASQQAAALPQAPVQQQGIPQPAPVAQSYQEAPQQPSAPFGPGMPPQPSFQPTAPSQAPYTQPSQSPEITTSGSTQPGGSPQFMPPQPMAAPNPMPQYQPPVQQQPSPQPVQQPWAPAMPPQQPPAGPGAQSFPPHGNQPPVNFPPQQ